MAIPTMGLSLAAVMLLSAQALQGRDYPQRSVRLVTSEAGGGTDFTARVLAQGLAGPLGQPVIVENRGGGGTITGEIVTSANPDGHTLLVGGGSFWLAPLFRKTAYDPVKGFTPISMLVNSPNVLVVPPSTAIKTVKDLLDMAKAKPGELNYATASIGSSVHLAAALFNSMAGVKMVAVPYRGSGPAIIGVVSAQVHFMFATPGSAAPHIKSGKLRAVAVTSAKSSAIYPDLPTVGQTVPGYESGGATGIFAPPSTSSAVISRLNTEIVRLLHQAEVKERFMNAGVEIVASSPERLTAAVKSEMARIGKVVQEAGLRAD